VANERFDHTLGQVDLATASVVEIEMDANKKLWVNVDGICRLRVGVAQHIVIIDNSQESVRKTRSDLGVRRGH
jgi:hypothetical protein